VDCGFGKLLQRWDGERQSTVHGGEFDVWEGQDGGGGVGGEVSLLDL
jgi:hypothetical protein